MRKDPIPRFRIRKAFVPKIRETSALLAKGNVPVKDHQAPDLDDSCFRAAEASSISNCVLGETYFYRTKIIAEFYSRVKSSIQSFVSTCRFAQKK